MSEQPELRTIGLRLRPFTLADAPEVTRLCSGREIAADTLLITHPYPEGLAEQWIVEHEQRFESGKIVDYAIALRSDAALIGSIGLKRPMPPSSAWLARKVASPALLWNRRAADRPRPRRVAERRIALGQIAPPQQVRGPWDRVFGISIPIRHATVRRCSRGFPAREGTARGRRRRPKH